MDMENADGEAAGINAEGNDVLGSKENIEEE